MTQPGRKPSAEVPVTVAILLRLRSETDADLVAWFASIPPKQRATRVKAALRAGGMHIVETVDTQDDDALDDFAGDLLL